MFAQSQNHTTLSISRATQSDSAAMKTVAVVTLTFLPATFVSVGPEYYVPSVCHSLIEQQALFSMSFFNFSPGATDAGDGIWTVSDKIWLYWLVAIPLTAVTMGIWFFWQHHWHREIN